MPAPDFTTLATAMETAERASRVALSEDQKAYLQDLLEITAGTNEGGVTVYRPWYGAYRLLTEDHDRLVEGDGARFLNQEEADVVHARLLTFQAAYDEQQGLRVPDAYAAAPRGTLTPGEAL